MSRNEGRIGSGGEEAIDAAEILAQIEAATSDLHRQAAVVRFLSGEDGWKEAREMLGGAFAPSAANKNG